MKKSKLIMSLTSLGIVTIATPIVTTSCNSEEEYVPVKSISFESGNLEISVGAIDTLYPIFNPNNVTDRGIIWASSDETVATVDDSGTVEGLKVGTCTITATSAANSEISAQCEITVNSSIEIAKKEAKWGEIIVRYRLMSGGECVLLSEDNGDNEYGYVDGHGTLVVPDYVVYENEKYYVRTIPSNWSNGENDITGVKFNCSQLRTIANKAFFHTNALDYYVDHKSELLVFPEGLRSIGVSAFEGTSFLTTDKLLGYSFSSTLTRIGARAFYKAPYIDGSDNNGELWFHNDDFDPLNIGVWAFNCGTFVNDTKYIYAPTLSTAEKIVNFLKETRNFDTAKGYLIPSIIPQSRKY